MIRKNLLLPSLGKYRAGPTDDDNGRERERERERESAPIIEKERQ